MLSLSLPMIKGSKKQPGTAAATNPLLARWKGGAYFLAVLVAELERKMKLPLNRVCLF